MQQSLGFWFLTFLVIAGCGAPHELEPGAQGGWAPTGYEGVFGEPLRCDGPGARFATHVVELAYGPGQDFGRESMPEIVLGPPQGGGCCAGSVDVVSLGNGGSIVLGFDGNAIVDGPGADFIVFENAFEFGPTIFAELATVAVSDTGDSWHAFPCEASEPPYGACAGHHPVMLDGEGALDPASAGGDPYDLADVALERARFVRITDRPDLEGAMGVFDLDAVGIVSGACL